MNASGSMAGGTRERHDEPVVTAVIVSYCSRATLSFALDPLRPAFDRNWLRCVVVDNASTDDTVGFLAEEYPWVDVIAEDENLGFGRACNVGFEHASTPYVLLLNPDARLPIADLELLVDFIETHPDVGIVGPAVREPGGWLNRADRLPTPRSILRGYLRAADGSRVIAPGAEPFRTNWLSAAVLLVRRATLEEIGNLDPRYFMYFEEADLCKRIERTHWEVWAVGGALGEHLSGVSAKNSKRPMFNGCIAEHYFRSRFYYLTKHFGWPKAALTEIGDLLLLLATQLPRALLGRDASELWVRLRSPMFATPSRIDKAHRR